MLSLGVQNFHLPRPLSTWALCSLRWHSTSCGFLPCLRGDHTPQCIYSLTSQAPHIPVYAEVSHTHQVWDARDQRVRTCHFQSYPKVSWSEECGKQRLTSQAGFRTLGPWGLRLDHHGCVCGMIEIFKHVGISAWTCLGL